MKKFLIIPLILSFLLPQFANAQVSGSAPLSVKNIDIASTASVVNVKFDLTNNKEVFVDELEYKVQFFKGDALANVGNIFSGLEYIYTQSDNLDPLNPKETKSVNINFSLPASIETGNYFARVLVENNIGDAFGINYTKNPFKLEGGGGFVGSLQAYVGTPEGLTSIRSGFRVSPNDPISIEIPLDENGDFENVLSSKDVFSKVSVHSISTEELVIEGKNNKIEIVDGTVSIPVPNGKNNKPGAYDVLVEITDEEGDKVATDIRARWFIDGFSLRVVSAETNTNFYKKSDPADFKAVISAGGHTSREEITVKAAFNFKEDNISAVLSKTYTLVHEDGIEEQLLIDFSDQKIGQKGFVDRVDVIVTDSKGNELAKTFVELSTDKIFGGNDTESLIGLISTILVLVGIIVVIAVIRKIRPELGDGRMDPSVGIGILIIASSLIIGGLVLNPGTSQAKHGDGSWVQSSIFMWSASNDGQFPSGDVGEVAGTCDQDLEVEVYVRGTCTHCVNDINLDIGFFENYTGQTFNQADTSIDIDIHDNTIGVTDPKGLLTGESSLDTTYYGLNDTTGDSTMYGPFVFKFNVASNPDLAGGTISQGYRLWGKTISDPIDPQFSYCVAGQTIIDERVSCNNVLDICENIDGIQEHVPSGHTVNEGSVSGDGIYECTPVDPIGDQAKGVVCSGDSGEIQIGDKANIGITGWNDNSTDVRFIDWNLPLPKPVNQREGVPSKLDTSYAFSVSEAKEYWMEFEVIDYRPSGGISGASNPYTEYITGRATKRCSFNGVSANSFDAPLLTCSANSASTNSSPYGSGEFTFILQLHKQDGSPYFPGGFLWKSSKISSVNWTQLTDTNGISVINGESDGWDMKEDTVNLNNVAGSTTSKGLHAAEATVKLKDYPSQTLSTICSINMENDDFRYPSQPQVECYGTPETSNLDSGPVRINWRTRLTNLGSGDNLTNLSFDWDEKYSSGANGTSGDTSTTHDVPGTYTSKITMINKDGFADTDTCSITIEGEYEDPVVDVCINLEGAQETVPSGYEDPEEDRWCTEVVEEFEEIKCVGTPNPLKLSDSKDKITWESEIKNPGTGTITYSWSGTSGAKGSGATKVTNHNNDDDGIVTAKVTASKASKPDISAICQVDIQKDYCKNIKGHQSSVPSGMTASKDVCKDKDPEPEDEEESEPEPNTGPGGVTDGKEF